MISAAACWLWRINKKVRRSRRDSRSHCWSRGVGAAPAARFCSEIAGAPACCAYWGTAGPSLGALPGPPTGRKAFLGVEFGNLSAPRCGLGLQHRGALLTASPASVGIVALLLFLYFHPRALCSCFIFPFVLRQGASLLS